MTKDQDTTYVHLVRKESTNRRILDIAAGRKTPSYPLGTHFIQSVKQLADIFSEDNLNLLEILYMAGHISLSDAATLTKMRSPTEFVEFTMTGLNLFLNFTPLPDGTSGVYVTFHKLQIDLDFVTPVL